MATFVLIETYKKKIVLHHFSYLFKQLFTTYLWIVIKDNLVLLQEERVVKHLIFLNILINFSFFFS